MRRSKAVCVTALAQLFLLSHHVVCGAEQRVRLSESYLPAAIQLIAHLVDQMAYDTSPSTKPTSKPTHAAPTTNPTHTLPTTKPTHNVPTTNPTVATSSVTPQHESDIVWTIQNGGWSMAMGVSTESSAADTTTPFHKPGLYQAEHPPGPGERLLVDPLYLDSALHLQPGELSEDSLQRLSPDLQEVLTVALDPLDPRAVPTAPAPPPHKLSQSNLRLLLLHDLLSREAKRLKLNEYGGFSPDVTREMDAAGEAGAAGGARAQLRLALGRMVERRDCEHDYANNRAKEMVAELARDDSLLSAETRPLQPLRYYL